MAAAELRKVIHEEIDRMPDWELEGLQKFLTSYPDELSVFLRNCPCSEEPVSDEDRRDIAEAREWFRQNGDRGIPHEEIKREFRLERADEHQVEHEGESRPARVAEARR